MTWIKLNYDRFLLALGAAVLFLCAVILFLQAHGFDAVFQSLREQVSHSTKIPAVNVASVTAEAQKLADPDTWKARMNGDRRIPVFVSAPYIEKAAVDANGETKFTAVDPLDANQNNIIHPPIPNRWFLDYKQDLLSTNALTEDTDGDGFTALDEWVGKTDPTDKESHPPYITKLFLKEFRRIPFRLLFAARNGDVALINTLDNDESTQFLRKGDLVRGTKFKVVDLKIKSDKVDGIQKDTSVITLQNQETKELIELPKEKEIDSPTTYAVMTYVWAGKDFPLHKGEDFTLKPEDTVKYHCVEIDANEVHLEKVGGGAKYTIGKLPAK